MGCGQVPQDPFFPIAEEGFTPFRPELGDRSPRAALEFDIRVQKHLSDPRRHDPPDRGLARAARADQDQTQSPSRPTIAAIFTRLAPDHSGNGPSLRFMISRIRSIGASCPV